MTSVNLIQTLFMKLNTNIPWEFNYLPFFTVAESLKHIRVKFGWLWFYVAIATDKESKA
jgi:hypothetical protein